MSLYRKYRPQTFEDVVGQEHVARTLRNALTAQPPRVAHAYLFTGPRGIGKTTNARLLAKCLNCEQGPTPRPCNQCDFCTRVANNQTTMDLIEIDAASNTGVDNVREVIIDKVNIAPAEGRYRVYIIDEVHMLSTSSFNALLKTLEEPPAHAIFILATTDSHKVPQTVLSRCQRFDFRRVTPPDIAKRLLYVAECENIHLHEDAAKLIARHADGALRDALTLLEQVSAFSAEEITASDVRLVLGGVPQELINGLVEGIASGDPRAVLTLLDHAVDEGASFSQLTRDLTGYVRDLLLLTVGFDGDGSLSAGERAQRGQHAQFLGRARIESLIGTLRDADKEMRNSTDHRLLLELTLVRACEGNVMVQAPVIAQPQLRSIPLSPVSTPAANGNGNGAWRPPVAPVQAPTVETPVPPVKVQQSAQEVETARPVPSIEDTAHDVEATESVEHSEHDEPEIGADETEITETELVPEAVAFDSVQDVAPPEVETEPVYEYEIVDVTGAVAEDAVAPAAAAEPETESETASKKAKKGRRISTYDELVELWPALLMRIRKNIGVTAVAYLHDARPSAFNEDELTLVFTKEFHHAKALDASKRLPFEDTINGVLNKPRRLRLVLDIPPPPSAKADPNPDPDPNDDDDFGAPSQDLVEHTRNIFAAEIKGPFGLVGTASMRNWFYFLFVLQVCFGLYFCCRLPFAYGSWWLLDNQKSSGIIRASHVDYTSSSRSSYYDCRVEYDYPYRNRWYHGLDIDLWHKGYGTHFEAQSVCTLYPIGKKVDVFVSRRRPWMSVLTTERLKPNIEEIVFFFVFLTINAFVLQALRIKSGMPEKWWLKSRWVNL